MNAITLIMLLSSITLTLSKKQATCTLKSEGSYKTAGTITMTQ